MEIARLFNAGTGEGRLPRLAQILVALELQLSAAMLFSGSRGARSLRSDSERRLRSQRRVYSRSARKTIIGVRRTNFRALRTSQVRSRMATMDDQIADIRNPRESVGKNENRIALIKERVAEE